MFEPVEKILALVKFTVIHLITFFPQCGWFWQHLIVISGPTLVGCLSLRTAQQKIRKDQVKLASMQSSWTRSSTRWDLYKAILYSHYIFMIRGYFMLQFLFLSQDFVNSLTLGARIDRNPAQWGVQGKVWSVYRDFLFTSFCFVWLLISVVIADSTSKISALLTLLINAQSTFLSGEPESVDWMSKLYSSVFDQRKKVLSRVPPILYYPKSD